MIIGFVKPAQYVCINYYKNARIKRNRLFLIEIKKQYEKEI